MVRAFDCWLDGKDHYAADRAEAERLLAIYPPLRDLVQRQLIWFRGRRPGWLMVLVVLPGGLTRAVRVLK